MNSEYFWWLAALALVAAGGIVAVLSWRPAPDDGWDDDAYDDAHGPAGGPDGAADARPAWRAGLGADGTATTSR